MKLLNSLISWWLMTCDKPTLVLMSSIPPIIASSRGLQRPTAGIHRRAAVWAICLAAICLISAVANAADPTLPSLEQVQKVIEKQFASLNDYKPGDLISRNQVKPIFDALNHLGWNVRDQANILRMIPSEDEFFVRELRTAAGRKFMRQSGKYPLAYDRIDRISHMIMGEQNVRALIRGPDGYKMIQYMTNTPYGRNLGQMLSQDPRGGDFNSSTGRIYTADALMVRLALSYEAEQERAIHNRCDHIVAHPARA